MILMNERYIAQLYVRKKREKKRKYIRSKHSHDKFLLHCESHYIYKSKNEAKTKNNFYFYDRLHHAYGTISNFDWNEMHLMGFFPLCLSLSFSFNGLWCNSAAVQQTATFRIFYFGLFFSLLLLLSRLLCDAQQLKIERHLNDIKYDLSIERMGRSSLIFICTLFPSCTRCGEIGILIPNELIVLMCCRLNVPITLVRDRQRKVYTASAIIFQFCEAHNKHKNRPTRKTENRMKEPYAHKNFPTQREKLMTTCEAI